MSNTDTTVTVTISTSQRLSNAAYHRSGGAGGGSAHWWLRSEKTGEFIDLPKRVRGDERRWELTLELAPGRYTLGVGKGRDAIRTEWEVTEDGQWV